MSVKENLALVVKEFAYDCDQKHKNLILDRDDSELYPVETRTIRMGKANGHWSITDLDNSIYAGELYLETFTRNNCGTGVDDPGTLYLEVRTQSPKAHSLFGAQVIRELNTLEKIREGLRKAKEDPDINAIFYDYHQALVTGFDKLISYGVRMVTPPTWLSESPTFEEPEQESLTFSLRDGMAAEPFLNITMPLVLFSKWFGE